MNTNISRQNFGNHFNKLLTAISQVVEAHDLLQTASRKQKRILQKPWLTKGLLISIKNKQNLHRTCYVNGNEFDKKNFKTYANKLTRIKNLSKIILWKCYN